MLLRNVVTGITATITGADRKCAIARRKGRYRYMYSPIIMATRRLFRFIRRVGITIMDLHIARRHRQGMVTAGITTGTMAAINIDI